MGWPTWYLLPLAAAIRRSTIPEVTDRLVDLTSEFKDGVMEKDGLRYRCCHMVRAPKVRFGLIQASTAMRTMEW